MSRLLDRDDLLTTDPTAFEVITAGTGPAGRLPLTAEMLRDSPSGDVFGLTQNAGMGWEPSELGRPQFLILSTQGGIRAPDGRPIALGYHTGHWEVGLLMQAAAEELATRGALPFAAYCSDPCDGRTQGTVGMMDSLAYRNDAARTRARSSRSALASPTASSRSSPPPSSAAAPAARPAVAASSSAPRRRRRWSARRSA